MVEKGALTVEKSVLTVEKKTLKSAIRAMNAGFYRPYIDIKINNLGS